MASLTDLVNSASESLQDALSSLCVKDPYRAPRSYFDEGGSNKCLNPSITEELYFSLDQPSISSFDPKFSVRARSEAATVASKLMEKSKLKGLVLEKEESVKKPTTAAKRKERKEKHNAGAGWFGMGTRKVDEDTQMDLQFLELRNFSNPKKFMKKQGKIGKHIEVGKLVPQAVDYYSDNRNKGKMKADHFVDQLIQDSEYKKFAKRKLREVSDKNSRGGKKRKTK